jgi:hypothetical protein
MAGKKGVQHKPDTNSTRQKMWRSMRIFKRFDIPSIMRTVPDSTYCNTRKFFKQLETQGIVAKVGQYTSGRAGEYQGYVLLKDIGPDMPGPRFDPCIGDQND